MAKRRSKRNKGISSEFKLAAFVVGIVLFLFAFDFVVSPSATVERVTAVTATVVKDVQEVAKFKEPEPAPAPQPAPVLSKVQILSPADGATVTLPTRVQIKVPSQASMCYYQIRDDGATTWDRRTPFCGEPIDIKASWCQTKGVGKCSFLYSATGNNGDLDLGTSTIYLTVS